MVGLLFMPPRPTGVYAGFGTTTISREAEEAIAMLFDQPEYERQVETAYLEQKVKETILRGASKDGTTQPDLSTQALSGGQQQLTRQQGLGDAGLG